MDLPLVYHSDYVAPLPVGHRFPMQKFSMLYAQLLRDDVASPNQFHKPQRATVEQIATVHCPDYIQAYCHGTLDVRSQRRIGLPWSPALVNRTCVAVGGTLLTAELALEHGLACNTAGGTHHAFPTYGSGFCIFNDLAIAATLLLAQARVEKLLIVDLDVHQGDGTAWIFQTDPRVFTFSMHCEVNFPGTKQHSDLDVALPVGMEDEAYLQTLAQYLDDLLSHVRPDLVLYDAGVDPHVGDCLGKLALTDSGLYRRDMQVLSTCISQGYPVAAVIGGGYCDDLEGLVYRHSLLHRAANQVYCQYRLG
jgi:acetoin utilization deacetylase AcuC-like enzyme